MPQPTMRVSYHVNSLLNVYLYCNIARFPRSIEFHNEYYAWLFGVVSSARAAGMLNISGQDFDAVDAEQNLALVGSPPPSNSDLRDDERYGAYKNCLLVF
jgi:hypothetical protein